MRSAVAGRAASMDGLTMSARARSSMTSGIQSREALVNTATGTSVICLMPWIISPSSSLRVGSPEPAKLMTSGLSVLRKRSSSERTSEQDTQLPRSVVCTVVCPSWQ